MARTIKTIVNSQKVNMGGIILEQPLPTNNVEQIDPFLLIHHWDDKLKGGDRQANAGVGPHPHRGFSPVTFIFKGGLLHQDSRGHYSEVFEGGTQWMDSGRGIIHSERPLKQLAEDGGDFEIIQFWVNTPTARKMDEPHYQPLQKENTPMWLSPDKKVRIGVVAGELGDTKGTISTKSPLLILRAEADKGGEATVSIPKNYNVVLYVLNGSISINGKEVTTKQLVNFNNDGDSVDFKVNEESRFIILSGEPLNEPLATHGPFVMNNQTEIMEAIRDYQMGKMGHLVEEFK
jgi:redox-sensitive bicupin YhaK (pirin superfamily)